MSEFLALHPLLLVPVIFLARIMDVSIGTLRTILVFRGHRWLAAISGFFEVLIWLAAAAVVFKNLNAWYLAVAYAGGFAAGNIAGMWLESKLAIGSQLVRAISENLDIDLAANLRARGYSVTELAGHNDDSVPVEVLLIVEKRRRIPALLELIKNTDPQAFWTLSDIKPKPIVPILERETGAPPPEWQTAVKKK